MPMCWLGGPEQCEFWHANQTREAFTPEGVLEGPQKLFHLICMFAWRWKQVKTVALFTRCSGSRYKRFRPCITGMRAVSVFLGTGQACWSLGSKKLWHAMDFVCGFHGKNTAKKWRLSSLVTSELKSSLFCRRFSSVSFFDFWTSANTWPFCAECDMCAAAYNQVMKKCNYM